MVLFGTLMLCAIPVLPIYLWRKKRLPAAVGIGLAVVWLAGYIALGSLVEEPKSEPARTRVAVTAKPTPSPTAGRTKAAPATAQPRPTTSVAKPSVPPKPRPADPCAHVPRNTPKAYVDKCEYGAAWPLTVDHGVVVCVPKPGTNVDVLTFVSPDGEEYALNGIAAGADYPDIDPIWRNDPDIPGAKVGIGPLIRRASSVC